MYTILYIPVQSRMQWQPFIILMCTHDQVFLLKCSTMLYAYNNYNPIMVVTTAHAYCMNVQINCDTKIPLNCVHALYTCVHQAIVFCGQSFGIVDLFTLSTSREADKTHPMQEG